MNNDDQFEQRMENPILAGEEDLCRALWLAVAIQAIIDATSKSRKKPAIKARSQALQWLADHADEESDLALVCDLAGIDFKKLRVKFKQVIRNPADTIDFRCLKKAGIDKRGNESRKRYFARARKNERIRRSRQNKLNEQTHEAAVIAPFCEVNSDHTTELRCVS